MRKSLVAACLAITVALVSSAVFAGPFGRKASQVDVPKLIVERPLSLGRAVLELSLGVGYRSVDSVFDSDGGVERSVKTISVATKDILKSMPEEVTTTYTIMDVGVNFGLTNNLTLGFNIPFYFVGQTIDDFDSIVAAENYPLLEDSLGDQEPSATNMGDATLWAIYQVWGKAAPLSSLAVKLVLKTTSGNDSFGDVTSETMFNDEKGEWHPDTVEFQEIKDSRTILTGTGQTDLALSLLFKQQFGPVAGTLEAGYNARFEDRVMYIPYLLGNTVGFTGKIDPGDEIFGNLELVVQPIEYVAIGADLRFFYRGKSRAAWPKYYAAEPSDTDPVYRPNDIFVGDHYRDVLIPEFAKDPRGNYVLSWEGNLATPVISDWHSSAGYLLTLRPKLFFFITQYLDITIAADIHLVGKNVGNLTNYNMGEMRDAPSITNNEQVIFPSDALGTGTGGVIIGAVTGTATVRF